MDTVPNKVEHLFLAQQFHDRKQQHARMTVSAEERSKVLLHHFIQFIHRYIRTHCFIIHPFTKTPFVDFLRPIVADADTGHGGITANMKLTKMFVERGAAGIHVEDQVCD